MRQRSRQSLRSVRTQRSAQAFAFGACTGVLMTSIASLRKTSSEAAAELAVAIVDQEAERLLPAVERHQEVARLLRHPGTIGSAGRGEQLDPPPLERDVGSAGGASAARQCRLARFPPAATSNRACGSPAHGSPTFFTAGIRLPPWGSALAAR